MKTDPELQPYLVRDALKGLDALLVTQPRGETLDCALFGAIVRLIIQAGDAGGLPPEPDA